ncbi:unnamed protein product [Didymodactylos carnosus]|uniref:Inhibitor of apoptosis 2 n=1 Tax=Didymodactylos carnosus TaxID=1234261 RepID=A0A814HGI4_9BILA|nr:unnamed protein product [Didymodactylos carnosus]CAF3781200.1 unnamed protein product [Didymodactylos carnosus]
MIASGFFNCNVGDRVICIYCNLICQQWIHKDDPSEVHKTLSSNCCFVKSNLVSTFSSTRAILNETLNVSANIETVLTQACNQQYIEIHKRQLTYTSWPRDVPSPSVDDLVRAGFFYSGNKAIVTCFYCNGSLQNWGEKDNPMIEHARWFPHCPYINQLCGDDLFQKIQHAKRISQQQAHTNRQQQQESMTKSNTSLLNVNSVVPQNSTCVQLQISDESALSRLVSARLDLPVSQRLLNKFKLSIIKRVYEDQLRLKLDDFETDGDMHMACVILQKQIQIIDGKKENIVIPSQKLREITEKNKQEVIIPQSNLAMEEDEKYGVQEETFEMVTSISPSANAVETGMQFLEAKRSRMTKDDLTVFRGKNEIECGKRLRKGESDNWSNDTWSKDNWSQTTGRSDNWALRATISRLHATISRTVELVACITLTKQEFWSICCLMGLSSNQSRSAYRQSRN